MTPRRILVLCTRRLGDVLLVTPLLRSLRRAWPEAAIDVLTLASSAAMLEGNRDIRAVRTIAPRAGVGESLRAIGGWRAYDLAVATLMDDRPQLMAWCAAPHRANVVPSPGEYGAWWKRRLAHEQVLLRLPSIHMVEQYLRLADALQLPRDGHVVPPRVADESPLDALLGGDWREQRYAVVHPMPLYAYKAWTAEGWLALLRGLRERGLLVRMTAGPAAAEREFVDSLARRADDPAVVSLAGQLILGQLTPLIERARVYVGPDTSITHLAAATGAPTIALFGPSSPVNWGPWPQGYTQAGDSPWQLRAPLQHESNVWIVQGITPCMPCLAEGCDRHPASRSLCLDQLPASRVLAAADQALSAAPG